MNAIAVAPLVRNSTAGCRLKLSTSGTEAYLLSYTKKVNEIQAFQAQIQAFQAQKGSLGAIQSLILSPSLG